jgi:hypothetical protein
MPVRQGNQGSRRVLLVSAVAGVLVAGGVGVAYASAPNPPIESGYAVEISTETPAPTSTWTDEECERWRAQQQGETPAPAESADPSEGEVTSQL